MVARGGHFHPDQPRGEWRRVAGAWLALSVAGAGGAAEPERGGLPRDPALTPAVLLQQALRQAPEYLALAARDEEARAHVAAARSWLAGRPALAASYADDQPRAATGMSELEYGVELPLWRPGERRAAADLGRTLAEQSAAWRAQLELTIAGRLRAALARLEAADRMQEIERGATAEAQQLVTSVEQLFDAGEAASLEVAQARTTLLAQRRQQLQAEAEAAAAEAAFTRLTGLGAKPAAAPRETPADRQAITPEHPTLRLLAADVSLAEQGVKRTRVEAKGSPALSVGARRERGSETEAYNDSVVVGLSVPFGGARQVAARVSSARREQVEAEVALKSAERELTQRLEEVRRELDLTAEALRLSEEQVALDRRQWELARTAFEVGETTLFQVVTALRQSSASAREHELLALRRASLSAEFNQTVGVLP